MASTSNLAIFAMSIASTGANPVLSGNISVTGNVSVNNSLAVGATFSTIGAPANGAIMQGNVGIGTATPTANLQVTGTAFFPGTASSLAAILTNSTETVNIVAAAPSATQTFYLNLGAVQYYTSNATVNWAVNIATSASTTLANALSVGQSVTLAMLASQGSSAYYNNNVQVDGSTGGVTTYWQGGTAPTKGNANGIDVYQYTVVKTAATPTYTILASQVQY